jgi:hypothetical protein
MKDKVSSILGQQLAMSVGALLPVLLIAVLIMGGLGYLVHRSEKNRNEQIQQASVRESQYKAESKTLAEEKRKAVEQIQIIEKQKAKVEVHIVEREKIVTKEISVIKSPIRESDDTADDAKRIFKLNYNPPLFPVDEDSVDGGEKYIGLKQSDMQVAIINKLERDQFLEDKKDLKKLFFLEQNKSKILGYELSQEEKQRIKAELLFKGMKDIKVESKTHKFIRYGVTGLAIYGAYEAGKGMHR